VTEANLERTRIVLDAIVEGTMPKSALGLNVGIFFDKRSLALGEPTSISVAATTQIKSESMSVAALNSWIEALPTEGESSGNPIIPTHTAVESSVVTTSAPDTTAPTDP